VITQNRDPQLLTIPPKLTQTGDDAARPKEVKRAAAELVTT